MSANLLSVEQINTIVNTVDPDHFVGLADIELTPEEVGQILFSENVRSVRYVSLHFEQPEDYQYKFSPYPRLHLLKTLDLLSDYEYQSCECPNWQESDAYKIVQKIRKLVVDYYLASKQNR